MIQLLHLLVAYFLEPRLPVCPLLILSHPFRHLFLILNLTLSGTAPAFGQPAPAPAFGAAPAPATGGLFGSVSGKDIS